MNASNEEVVVIQMLEAEIEGESKLQIGNKTSQIEHETKNG